MLDLFTRRPIPKRLGFQVELRAVAGSGFFQLRTGTERNTVDATGPEVNKVFRLDKHGKPDHFLVRSDLRDPIAHLLAQWGITEEEVEAPPLKGFEKHGPVLCFLLKPPAAAPKDAPDTGAAPTADGAEEVLLTLDRPGHREDKNFAYHARRLGPGLIGFLGSPNLLDSVAVRAVAVAPSTFSIASGAANGTVRIWDSRTGREILALQKHSGPVEACACRQTAARWRRLPAMAPSLFGKCRPAARGTF